MDKNKKISRPKVGLALSGGSALGLAHIGVIKALRKHRVPIDFISGTSAGAIAAAALAFDIPLKTMVELTKNLSWANMSKFGYSRMGLNSNKPVGELIEKMLGDAKIEDAKIPLAIIATDIDTGKKIVFQKGNVADAVMASTCLPGYYVPVNIEGKKLVDGGLVENLPLSPLRQMGAEVVIGVDLERWKKIKEAKNVLNVITNSYSTLIRPQSYFFQQQSDVLIEPHLEKFTSSDFDKTDELLKVGYDAVECRITKIKKLLRRKEKMIVLPTTLFQKIADFFTSRFSRKIR